MLEYVTEALVLDKVDLGEQDLRVFLFTKDFGRVAAKIKSGKKITSKLAAHSEPLNFVTVRIVDKNKPQLIDVLSCGKLIPGKTIFKTLSLIKEISPENQPDLDLWNFLMKIKNKNVEEDVFIETLMLLGFDPKHAKCNNCLKGSPDFFSVKDLAFYCRDCFKSH